MNEYINNISKSGYSKDQKHYVAMPPIVFMQSTMTKEQFIGFCIGNVIKYLARADYKNQKELDLEKARQYSWWAEVARTDKKVNDNMEPPSTWDTKVY